MPDHYDPDEYEEGLWPMPFDGTTSRSEYSEPAITQEEEPLPITEYLSCALLSFAFVGGFFLIAYFLSFKESNLSGDMWWIVELTGSMLFVFATYLVKTVISLVVRSVRKKLRL